jgi:hypothetical protein
MSGAGARKERASGISEAPLYWLTKRDEVRNYFMSEECLRTAELVAAV